MRVTAITYLFLIRLRFRKSKSISDILPRRYGQSTVKSTQKFEKLDCRLRKAELHLECLLRCRDSKVIPNFLNFRVSSQSLKACLIYKQRRLKFLQEEICHKKSDIRVLKEKLNYSHSSLQHEISFIDFAHVSSLYLRSNNRILASKSATKQEKLSKLVKPLRKILVRPSLIVQSINYLTVKKGFYVKYYCKGVFAPMFWR